MFISPNHNTLHWCFLLPSYLPTTSCEGKIIYSALLNDFLCFLLVFLWPYLHQFRFFALLFTLHFLYTCVEVSVSGYFDFINICKLILYHFFCFSVQLYPSIQLFWSHFHLDFWDFSFLAFSFPDFWGFSFLDLWDFLDSLICTTLQNLNYSLLEPFLTWIFQSG